jgi:hypothetical protein
MWYAICIGGGIAIGIFAVWLAIVTTTTYH